MQKAILFPAMLLFISVAVSAQSEFPSTTVNNSRLVEKETTFSVTVVPDQASPAFNLYIDNPGQKKINLRISHSDEGMVVDTVINAAKFSGRFNFDQANDGVYVVSLLSGKDKITRAVEINTVTRRSVKMIE